MPFPGRRAGPLSLGAALSLVRRAGPLSLGAALSLVRRAGPLSLGAALSLVRRAGPLSLGAALCLVGCDGTGASDAPSCRADQERSCTGEDDCSGIERCNDSGQWTACDCEDDSSAGGTGGAPSGLRLGDSCDQDSDCDDGQLCLDQDTEDWLGGAPSSGFCVADCTGSPELCEEFEAGLCVAREVNESTEEDVPAYCMPACTLGASGDEADPCAGISATVCDSLSQDDNLGFCRPLCQFDDDCKSGRCDRSLAVCVAEAPGVEAGVLGEPCDVEAPACNGLCLALNTGETLCSHRCRYGDTEPCELSSEGDPRGICGFAAPGAALGDVGYCTPLCNCDSDCQNPELFCTSFDDPLAFESLGAQGFCAPGPGSGLECS